MSRTTLAVAGLALALLAGCGPDRPVVATSAASASQTAASQAPASPTDAVPTTAPARPPAPTTTQALRPTPARRSAAVFPTLPAGFYAARAVWRVCTGSTAAVDFVDLRGFQCATVRVPLDYRHPAGRTLSIGIARLRASGSHRIGSLVIDPGGPGASGLLYLTAATRTIPAAVRARFDIVGFDPRGVGVSAGLHCLAPAQLDRLQAADPIPTTPAQVSAAVARAALLADGCRRTAGWELPFLGTTFAARDLDLIRSAIGDARLSYLGKSYGTLLGAVYADEFPKRVRALVLDGALPPTSDPADLYRRQGAGFEGDLRDFLSYCVGTAGCPFSGSSGQARRELDAFLASVRAKPVSTGGNRQLTVGEAIGGITAALYSTSYWPYLKGALTSAKAGSGGPLLALADSLASRHSTGYETIASAFPAISCADWPTAYTPAQAAVLARRWAVASPLFGPLEAWGLLTCTGWVPSQSRLPARVTAKGAPPILVVGSTGDPATPYAGAKELTRQLDGARLLTFVGDGHTVYGHGRSPCIDSAVNAYLLELRLPATGLRCTG